MMKRLVVVVNFVFANADRPEVKEDADKVIASVDDPFQNGEELSLVNVTSAMGYEYSEDEPDKPQTNSAYTFHGDDDPQAEKSNNSHWGRYAGETLSLQKSTNGNKVEHWQTKEKKTVQIKTAANVQLFLVVVDVTSNTYPFPVTKVEKWQTTSGVEYFQYFEEGDEVWSMYKTGTGKWLEDLVSQYPAPKDAMQIYEEKQKIQDLFDDKWRPVWDTYAGKDRKVTVLTENIAENKLKLANARTERERADAETELAKDQKKLVGANSELAKAKSELDDINARKPKDD